MNGAHDLGGMHGFGRIESDPNEPVFHHDWERRALAVTLAMGSRGHWNLDMSRYARECCDPAVYLNTSYYEHWLHGLERLVDQFGLVTTAELSARIGLLLSAERADAGETDSAPALDDRALRRETVAKTLGRGSSARLDADAAAKFAVGDRVTAININPTTHTRLPRYLRGRRGTVDRIHGGFIFPDEHATTGKKRSEILYNVRFTAADVWGSVDSDADTTTPQRRTQHAIYVDLFEPYLAAPDDSL